jgi:hypothetical protein
MGADELGRVPSSEPHASLQFLHQRGLLGLSNSSKRILHLIQDIEGLTDFQKRTIIVRYISILENLRTRTKLYASIFHIGRGIITIGSLIVPALMSIQYSNGNDTGQIVSYAIYWVTWSISLLVTTFNGVLTLFKIDKKYYFLHTIFEQLKSEAWQYIHLSGKYGGYYTKGLPVSHANQYVFFCHNLEKVKLKQVDEEYYKWIDAEDERDEKKAASKKMIAGLYAPTPSSAQLLTHQQQLANALNPRPPVDGEERISIPYTETQRQRLESIPSSQEDETSGGQDEGSDSIDVSVR